MAWKTSIDSNICTGNKKCAEACPEVYEIIDGYGEVKKGMETVPENLLAKVRAAVAACPEEAVKLEQV
ncbi:MAG TPA: ferredoxin [Chloroflexota bacterium]|nr:ferredoxin [Chloroflexota bacterium]